MTDRLQTAFANARAHLLSLRGTAGHWQGELSSSALSTATALVALHGVDAIRHRAMIEAGARWLASHQNTDGGWGDTTLSQSNLSTTLLCWSALRLWIGSPSSDEAGRQDATDSVNLCEAWITRHVGCLDPAAVQRAVISRYGKDRTFSVPILMLCAICGTLGERAWERVLPLPFELAAFPRRWFGAIGLPVVSYALPALIAIGRTRHQNAPPAWWNPLRWIRAALWPRISPMLKALQPCSGGYLEATPLTSFVTMALAAAGEKDHLCIPGAVEFLSRSMRPDGSWPIDTNLATWGSTLSVKALDEIEPATVQWLLEQQYQDVHPFTNAAPGGWAWTDLPGGVPDADDTSGALIALRKASDPVETAAQAGITWLLDLQNRDGGVPTFCRGWGTLPFDRSTPEITAHALLAWWVWQMPALMPRIRKATQKALAYLQRTQRADGSWSPLWFGNEQVNGEENPVFGTAAVVNHLSENPALAQQAQELIRKGLEFLLRTQKPDGGFGGDAVAPSTVEETALAAHALLGCSQAPHQRAGMKAVEWLLSATREGTEFHPAPIGLYFARLWYHEKLYPIVWTAQAFRRALRP